VSNFTLLGDARKGRRPSFIAAAPAEQAGPLHEHFVECLRHKGLDAQTGIFGSEMKILSQAAGPVNVVIDSPPRLAEP
jgi:D-tyrosyl-tRNA(Tyr) deacylase